MIAVPVLQAQGCIGEADYVAAQFLHLRPSPLIRSALALLVLAALIALALTQSVLLLAVLSGVAGYVLLAMPWRARRLYRRNPAIAAPQRLDVSADGLLFHRGGHDQLLRWDRIGRWRAGRGMVLLYPVQSGFYLLPASFFASDADYRRFLELLQRHAGTPA